MLEQEVLKKVIIIAYYYPPGPTPANRVMSWIKYFPDKGIYPILITRAIDGVQSIEKLGNAEIHRINSEAIYNERFSKLKVGSLLRMLMSKIYSITLWLTSFDKTYKSFSKYFNENFAKDNHLVIITGSPFNLFKIGYDCSKDYGGQWVADYRDLWNQSEMPKQFDTLIERAYRQLVAIKIQARWTQSACHVTTVSDYLGLKLSNIYNGNISVIENGFFESEHINFRNQEKSKVLSFVYIGTIYRTQKIQLCIKAISEALSLEGVQGEFLFIGSSFDRSYRQFISEWNNDFLSIRTIPKLDKVDCLREQSKCHVGIMCSYGPKGIPSSKLYEYLGLHQPVLHFPSDEDVVADTLLQAGLGFVFKEYNEAVAGIRELVRAYSTIGEVKTNPQIDYINKFSRVNLAQRFLHDVVFK